MIYLNDRTIVKVGGNERYEFLQGLITNDIHKVTESQGIYTCLLSPQGKFLYDFFIIKEDDYLLLDCLATKASELIRKLKMYQLRSKVTIEEADANIGVFAIIDKNIPLPDMIQFTDPRHHLMGSRLIGDKSRIANQSITEDSTTYEDKRLQLGIPESEKDFFYDAAFPLQYGLDHLHAIDYKKGCYVGQEVTARSTYRGTIRKAIYKVTGNSLLPPLDTEITVEGTKIGVMRSSKENIGLALLNSEDAREQATTDGQEVMLSLPDYV